MNIAKNKKREGNLEILGNEWQHGVRLQCRAEVALMRRMSLSHSRENERQVHRQRE